MPTRRALTKDEFESRQRKLPGLRLNRYEHYTFLTDEDKALLTASDERGDTVEEFLERLSADGVSEADRYVLADELETRRSRAARKSSPRRSSGTTEDDRPVRQRQPVSTTNPFGAYLDERHDNLPEFPADPAGAAQMKKLQGVTNDYTDAADVLEAALDSMADEFADAFEAEDAKRAVRARINGAGMSDAEAAHRKRMSRIG